MPEIYMRSKSNRVGSGRTGPSGAWEAGAAATLRGCGLVQGLLHPSVSGKGVPLLPDSVHVKNQQQILHVSCTIFHTFAVLDGEMSTESSLKSMS